MNPSLKRLLYKSLLNRRFKTSFGKYSSHITAENELSISAIEKVLPSYAAEKKYVDGRIIIRDNFDRLLNKHPEIFIFGGRHGIDWWGKSRVGRASKKIWRLQGC